MMRAALACALCVLSGCGGGGGGSVEADAGSAPQSVLLDRTTTFTGLLGNQPSGGYTPNATIDGPTFSALVTGPVEVCFDIVWVQELRRRTGLRFSTVMQDPMQPSSVITAISGVVGSNTLRNKVCGQFSVTAGRSYQTRFRASFDPDCTSCSDALAAYSATVTWRVTATR